MREVQIFISGRMGNGELDADRAAARATIERRGGPFKPFLFDRLPDPPVVWASDAEARIAQSQMFLLLMASTLSPRVVDELRFAQRLGLDCFILLKQGVPRRPDVSEFLSNCGCPVYPYGTDPGSLPMVLESVLNARVEWQDSADVVIDLGRQTWDAIVKALAQVNERVYELSPRRFEELIAELLASFDYSVELTPQSRDGGRDIIATRALDIAFPSQYYIETKLWRPDLRVGVPVIQKVIGAGTVARVNGVMIITPSAFARTVVPYLTLGQMHHYVRLVDGAALPTWYLQYLTRHNIALAR